MSTRRGFLGWLGLGGAAGVRRAAIGPTQTGHGQIPGMVMVDVLKCGRCGRDLLFLPEQRRNRCGWCGKVTDRGLV